MKRKEESMLNYILIYLLSFLLKCTISSVSSITLSLYDNSRFLLLTRSEKIYQQGINFSFLMYRLSTIRRYSDSVDAVFDSSNAFDFITLK